MTPRRISSLALGVLLAGCAGADQPIRLGVAGPFSDPVGGPMRMAAELAVAEINAVGGVDGRLLELVTRDDFGDPDSAVRVAASLAAEGVVAVIGHVYSGTTLAASPVYASGTSPVPVITPSSSAPGLSEAGDHLFRLCPTDLEHGAALAAWVRHGLRLQRGAVLYLNDAYGRGVRRVFSARFGAMGGEILESYPYLGDRPDVRVYLDRLVARGLLEFLVVAGNRDEAEAILRQARDRGLTAPVLGADGLEGIETAGPLAEGVHLTAAYLPSMDTPANRRFVSAYLARYPGSAAPNQPAAATYDAVYLLRDVLRSGTSRRAVLRTLSQIGRDLPPVQGVTGVIAFDELGDLARRPVLIGVVRAGRIQVADRR
jgi:branched-chain amino acid transport system substrate-binding protein